MKYFVNVTIQVDETYVVEAEDEYDARDAAEQKACQDYNNLPYTSVEAWDVSEIVTERQ